MKRTTVFLLAMAILAVIGIPNVTAQTMQLSTMSDLSDFVGGFNAVPTLSTEARYSVGLFTSDVDDFISVNDYDPDIGTFFFLGGFPQNSHVEDTNLLATRTTGDYAISAGFAKSFSKFYLGVYLGGNVVDARGNRTGGNPRTSSAAAIWDANLAVLFGTSRIGGLRFDLIMDNVTDQTTRSGGSATNGTSGQGVTVALRWGKTLSFGSRDIDTHAMAGFRFPDYELVDTGSGKIHHWGTHTTSGDPAELLVNGGIAWGLNDISTLEADLYLGGNFGGASFGDISDTTPGAFGALIETGLANTFEPFNGLELALKPTLGIGIGADNSGADFAGSFNLAIGVDAGLKARLPGRFNKFSVITGVGINIFEWHTETSFGDPRSSNWWVTGIRWNEDTFTAKGTLGLGMVFVPINNLSVGFGLNVLVDSIVEFDLVQMQVRSGDFFTDFNGPLVFDLTVSYKF